MTAALLINRRRHVFANYQRVIARRPLLNCTVLRSAAAHCLCSCLLIYHTHSAPLPFSTVC